MSEKPRPNLLTIIGPGILVAATGVGAGDLATGAIVGGKLGVAILWAVIVGAFLKFVLTEGLVRWQLVTGDIVLEGCAHHFGGWALWTFLGSYGTAARVAFLVGCWGAVFSSLLGVWQSVPYLFADLRHLMDSGPAKRGSASQERTKIDTQSTADQGYLLGLAVVPAIGLFFDFVRIQMLYAIVGALFIPMLAAALLVLNGRRTIVGEHRNSRLTSLLLAATLIFFLVFGVMQVRDKLRPKEDREARAELNLRAIAGQQWPDPR
ncbi:hypothetical protein MYX75_06500 [Acidobacteria bacterium AH-259-A15]|nr:hypothetical protein [Acidobacteria bacterium AH-259-A15]